MIVLYWVKPKQLIPLRGNDFRLAPHPRKQPRNLSTASAKVTENGSDAAGASHPDQDSRQKLAFLSSCWARH